MEVSLELVLTTRWQSGQVGEGAFLCRPSACPGRRGAGLARGCGTGGPRRDRAGQDGRAWIDPEALGASRVLDIEDAAAKGAEGPPVLSGHRREEAVNNVTNL